ncbi:hypothetical protein BJY16_005121 [Actinoplanes octamycinicus]|uniref:Caspase domain-containing protein n=1 Tax=Actinoplanes octamycinicus TaxID=135948 RepID=A0A7W7M981_9ACTN|nr:caspase family protein [Actinoplanes octamycinicus]MBB4741662.1 hypothetical protein [Actinoplanes octamycinicus]GIE57215.1 hypothetical protein Aoc01nite_26170 [Actinoplanes octamycinicus]
MFLDRRPDAGPGLHALIIGVGHHPFLTGDHLRHAGPTDAGTAPASALRFLDCLLARGVGNWARPVATVDVLLSPVRELVSPDGRSVAVEEPTRRNVQAAFDQWLERCESHPDNIAVLYFSGLGVQTGQQVLLTSDFAASEDDPFRGAFAFDTSRDGLLTRLPSTQCLFVDAGWLRLGDEVIRRRGRGAEPLIAPGPFAERKCRHDLTLRAPQLPDTGAPLSPFTSALIKALEGVAATEDPETGDWVLSTASISQAMTVLVQRELGKAGTGRAVPGAEIFEPAVLRRLLVHPQVEGELRWKVTTSGRVRCVPRLRTGAAQEFWGSIEGPQCFSGPAGHYVAKVDSFPGVGELAERPLLALPPAAEILVGSA